MQFDVGWYSDGSATPDLLETSIDKPEYASGDTMVVSVNAYRRQAHHQRARRPPADDADRRRQGRHPAGQAHVGKDWGTGAYVLALCRRCGGAADAGAGDRPEMVRHRQEDPHAAGRAVAAALVRPGTTLKIPVKLGGLNPGEDAKIVIAAVDVGILNLTNYKPPAPMITISASAA